MTCLQASTTPLSTKLNFKATVNVQSDLICVTGNIVDLIEKEKKTIIFQSNINHIWLVYLYSLRFRVVFRFSSVCNSDFLFPQCIVLAQCSTHTAPSTPGDEAVLVIHLGTYLLLTRVSCYNVLHLYFS